MTLPHCHDLLLAAPVLMVLQAMKAVDFTPDESADRATQMKVGIGSLVLSRTVCCQAAISTKMMEMVTTMPTPLPKGRMANANVKRQ